MAPYPSMQQFALSISLGNQNIYLFTQRAVLFACQDGKHGMHLGNYIAKTRMFAWRRFEVLPPRTNQGRTRPASNLGPARTPQIACIAPLMLLNAPCEDHTPCPQNQPHIPFAITTLHYCFLFLTGIICFQNASGRCEVFYNLQT